MTPHLPSDRNHTSGTDRKDPGVRAVASPPPPCPPPSPFAGGSPSGRREFLARSACLLGGAAAASLEPLASLLPGVTDRLAGMGVYGAHAAGPPIAGDPHIREAYFYDRLEGGTVQCRTCPHECALDPGETGICRAKRNIEGTHCTLSYGNPCTAHVDPVEKKPLFHFLPGTKAFSLAVAGCNFRCLNCQNWQISQVGPGETRAFSLPPEEVAAAAVRYGCRSVAYTYSEPTSYYEYGVDSSVAAREAGIRNIWVSNGYIRRKPLDRLSQSLDGAAINLKSYSEEIYQKLNGGSLQPVLDTLVRLKENGVWLEVIHLLVPTWTDDFEMIRRMCGWFVQALGPDTPFHFSRFHPLYKLVHLAPTPVEDLVRAREIALSEGIHHVYIGNVPGAAEDTICPGCRKTVVVRRGFRIESMDLEGGRCRFCNEAIAGVWA